MFLFFSLNPKNKKEKYINMLLSIIISNFEESIIIFLNKVFKTIIFKFFLTMLINFSRDSKK